MNHNQRYDDEYEYPGKPRSKRIWWVLGGLAAAVLLIGYFLSSTAHAHDAPTGWSYPTSCCSGVDCREVADKAIEETRFGYRIAATGETIIYSDVRIKNSPDGHMHWCSVMGAEQSRTLCLFVPSKGF